MDDGDSARVLGVGVGLFLIILIWALAVAGLLFLTRLKTGPSVGIISAATLLTLILLVIPRKDKLLLLEEEEEVESTVPSVPTDGMFIWRTIMAILASLSAITGTAVVAVDYAMHQVKFKPTNNKKM